MGNRTMERSHPKRREGKCMNITCLYVFISSYLQRFHKKYKIHYRVASSSTDLPYSCRPSNPCHLSCLNAYNSSFWSNSRPKPFPEAFLHLNKRKYSPLALSSNRNLSASHFRIASDKRSYLGVDPPNFRPVLWAKSPRTFPLFCFAVWSM